ncbi:cyclic-di-AMP receptor [Nicoliella lavandulae]|uniref:Cyclic-di-AMP receptor n=1 Tax=Nicoliella lavandulae TaxID=3082954 RepID=A0ABU8SK13_9LACO
MKLLIAVIQDKDTSELQEEFIKNNIRATKLSTTGGFLKSGNTTYMIGIEDEKVDKVLDIIKTISRTRKKYMTPPVNLDGGANEGSYPVKIQVGGATVMILPMDQFYQF